MSAQWSNCLKHLLSQGKLTKKQARDLDEYVNKATGVKAPRDVVARSAEAERAALEAYMRDGKVRQAQAVFQARTNLARVADFNSHDKRVGLIYKGAAKVYEALGKTPPARLTQRARNAGLAMLTPDPHGVHLKNVETEQHAAHHTIIDTFRGALGAIKKMPEAEARLAVEDAVRILRGSTKTAAQIHPQASIIADGIKGAREKARLMFTAAGGDIRERQDFGTVQTHDMEAWRKADLAVMLDELAPTTGQGWLDPAKFYVGSRIGTIDELREVITKIHGENKVGKLPPLQGARGDTGSARSSPRILPFRDGDTLLAYTAKYGQANLVDAIERDFFQMARDIGTMRVFGPRPDEGYAMVRTLMSEHGAGQLATSAVDKVYLQVTGALDIPGHVAAAHVHQSVQMLLSAAQLGSAAVASLTDIGTQAVTARYNGLKAVNIARNFTDLVKNNEWTLVDGTKLTARDIAFQAGAAAQSYITTGGSPARFQSRIGTAKTWADKLSDGVMRYSGLEQWTEQGRNAFVMEFSAQIAQLTKYAWDDIPKVNAALAKQRNALERYGFTPELWEAARTVALIEAEPKSGARWFSIENVHKDANLPADVKAELASRYLGMVRTEMDFAVVSPNGRVQAMTKLGAAPGTIQGGFGRALFQYKAFPITMIMTHGARALYQPTFKAAAMYAIETGAMLTIAGTLVAQMKQVLKGQDMTEWDDPSLWLRGFVQGGAAGIFGDVLDTLAERKYGKTDLLDFVGPQFSLVEEIADLGVNAAGMSKDFLLGRPTADERAHKLWGDLVRFGGRYAPGSKLWYARLAIDRWLLDTLERAGDPHGAANSFKASRRWAREQTGADSWWARGEPAPERAPQLGVE